VPIIVAEIKPYKAVSPGPVLDKLLLGGTLALLNGAGEVVVAPGVVVGLAGEEFCFGFKAGATVCGWVVVVLDVLTRLYMP
jgi:hypothetical protein